MIILLLTEFDIATYLHLGEQKKIRLERLLYTTYLLPCKTCPLYEAFRCSVLLFPQLVGDIRATGEGPGPGPMYDPL